MTAMPQIILAALLVILSSVPAAAGPPSHHRSPLGVNLSSITYGSSELVFIDVFKQSQPWTSQAEGKPYGKGGPLLLDENGWVRMLGPGQHADTLMLRAGGNYPAGEYVCLYEGRGRIEFDFDARVTRRQEGRIQLQVTPSDHGMVLRLVETDPLDPVRNIRVFLPGYEQDRHKRVFHPDFLARWAPFRVLRFTGWMQTNDSNQADWKERPTLSMQTQAGPRGMALEHMIRLANSLQAEPWFSLPHQVTDEYVRSFARMVRDDLDPGLRVHVEYSNETWNSQFEQAGYCRRMGRSLQLGRNGDDAGHTYYSRRSVELFRIWEEVFGRQRNRLVRVLSSQSANPWVSRQIMEFEDAWRHADVLAIAPYFGRDLGGPQAIEQTSRMTVAQILAACDRDARRQHELVARHVKEATSRGLAVAAYEGGQHLAGYHGAENNEVAAFLFQEANRHPRMKAVCLGDLEGWKRAGGQLFMTFASMGPYNKWGSWGMFEHGEQRPADAPKYLAALEFIRKYPRWW